jgi:hypothetical protein
VEEDGTLSCELLWAPITVSVSSLKGALLERAEELAKRDHGVDMWDKWLEMQGRPADSAAAEEGTPRGGSNCGSAVFRFASRPLGRAKLLRDSKIDNVFDSIDLVFVIYSDPSPIISGYAGTYYCWF